MRPIMMACLLALLVPPALPVAAADQLQTGKELFNAQLGSNGKTCNSCHPDGKGLERAGNYDRQQLRDIINNCIEKALQREMLPPDDPRLTQLESYVRSLKK